VTKHSENEFAGRKLRALFYCNHEQRMPSSHYITITVTIIGIKAVKRRDVGEQVHAVNC
jgi:hypothetical protein